MIKNRTGENVLIKKYILALTNLYGLVTPLKVAEVYNMQNEEKISFEQVSIYLERDLSGDFVYSYYGYFVHETVLEFDEFELLKSKKQNKPFYVPDKEDLLRYSDMNYYEKPEAYDDLVHYFEKNFFPDEHEHVEMLCEDMIKRCMMDFQVKDIGDFLNSAKVDLRDMHQFKEVTRLIMNLANSVRLWENNGYTPDEIFGREERSELNPVTWETPDIRGFKAEDTAAKVKIGRNDPCPCGSGKKYKKCCMGRPEHHDEL